MASGSPGLSQPYSFNYARATLGETLNGVIGNINSLFRGRNTETHTLADAGKAALNDGDAVNKVATIVNTDDNTSAIVHLQGGGNSVSILSQSGATFGTSEDTDAQTNVYWDSGNSRYELNNEKGGERTYEVTFEGA